MFSHRTVFHCSLNDCKSPQVSRTLLSILADLNNAIIWMVSTRTLFSKSFSPCNNPFVTLLSAPITIGITVTFMFHGFFFCSLARSKYLSTFSLSFISTLWWTKTIIIIIIIVIIIVVFVVIQYALALFYINVFLCTILLFLYACVHKKLF